MLSLALVVTARREEVEGLIDMITLSASKTSGEPFSPCMMVGEGRPVRLRKGNKRRVEM
jgi:hypothetical protein